MKLKTRTLAATGVALFCVTLVSAYAYDGEQYAKDAKVTMKQARAKALKVAPGKIRDAELEKEGGGSGLRYSFDISTDQGLREVGIDAVTGKVLEKSRETFGTEAREMKSEHEQVDRDDDQADEQGD